MSPGEFSPGSAEDDSEDPGFRLPPALARLPDGGRRLRREFVEQNQRDRILLAALDVFAEKGFAAASVQDLIEEASTSRATFYKHFSDKEAALAALHDEVLGWLEEQARDAAREAADWTAGVLSVCDRLLGLMVEDPRLARLCGVEVRLGGPAVRSRHEAALAELAAALRRGRSERPRGEELPVLLEPLLLAGVEALVLGLIGYGEEPGAGALIRDLPEIVLLPYLGAEGARRAVRGPA